MFLNRDELKALTGYVRVSAQIRWLTEQGFRFTVNGLGRPVVAVAEVDRRLVGGPPAKRAEPNFSALYEPRVRFDGISTRRTKARPPAGSLTERLDKLLDETGTGSSATKPKAHK
ncbi:MAG TPA: DUF4224 domain-containing protein [Steroidobacteraceae bacterium]|jgi:hypothetical protein|nr:DUF4224 domain-containing protein [Steroidobacteraceae bacterium]